MAATEIIEERFKPIFEPIQINKLKISNRLVLGPMAVTACTAEGYPSDQTIAFFKARAKGGVGLIIVGGSIATPRGFNEAPFKPLLRFDVDDYVPKHKRLSDAIHAMDVPIIIELSGGFGRLGMPPKGVSKISASPKELTITEDNFPNGFIIPGGVTLSAPEQATLAEVKEVENETIKGGIRAFRAGFDGAEIGANMSYFISSFVAPRNNWRKDEYGGPIENRARILVNIIKGIRQGTRPDFVIGLRITAEDGLPDGLTPQDYADVAKLAEAAGADYISLAYGVYETMSMGVGTKDGGMAHDGSSKTFKDTLSIPVMIQGIHDPERIAQAIAGGQGDLAMLARPLLADPNYPNKVKTGRQNEIVVCDRDHLCMRRMIFGMPVRCSMNPAMGREARIEKGEGRPLKRYLAAPKEWLILKLTSSKTFMTPVMKLVRKVLAMS